ncbi:Ferric siderophore transport system protein, TonB family [Pseudomonas syringae pv. aptata]|uniref:Ferric siderophore transport system protein, TonB family n=1 Tax=Pseudomonas syringae pv. aptata TaxID=83167 RepID=A0A3M3XCX8_PSEAP|nr:Ferric siderophore transport system protein, TonB family [Pseudomonas syringae pv. aptata]
MCCPTDVPTRCKCCKAAVPALDEAAQAAVRQWTFIPAKRGDTPVEGWVNVPMAFKLAP